MGSAVDLGRRLRSYYSYSVLRRLHRSIIYQALLRHGYSPFSLLILEYCSSEDVRSREQYYLDSLAPEYNICKIAGVTTGRQASIETRQKMSEVKRGRLFSEERKESMRKAREGKVVSEETRLKMSEKHTGKTHTEETKAKIMASHPQALKVKFRDLETGNTGIYDSVRALARALELSDGSISKYLKSKSVKPFKKRYEIVFVDV